MQLPYIYLYFTVSCSIIRQEESARAHRVRKRLGVPGAIKEISPASSIDEVVQALCKRLDEPKVLYESRWACSHISILLLPLDVQ